MIPADRLPDEITYRGSDGGRHYARVTERHQDGSVTISRGYYGTSRTTFGPEDEPRDYRTGAPVR